MDSTLMEDIKYVREVSAEMATQSPTLAMFQAKLNRVFASASWEPMPTLKLNYKPPALESTKASLRKQLEKWTATKGDCLVWFGRTHYGNPVVNVKGKTVGAWKAFRIFLEGKHILEEEKYVRTCGNRRCVKPEHLSVVKLPLK